MALEECPSGRHAWVQGFVLGAALWAGGHAAAVLAPVQTYDYVANVDSLALAPDDSVLAVGGTEMLALMDPETGAFIHSFPGIEHHVETLAFSPDGGILLAMQRESATGFQFMSFWDIATREPIDLMPNFVESVTSAAWSPDGSQMLTAIGNDAQLWDIGSGALVRTFTGHDGIVRAVAFSANGAHLATGSADETVRVWEMASGAELRSLEGHTARILSVAFLGSGKRIVSTSSDRSAIVWDVDTGDALTAFTDRNQAVQLMAVSPDGTHALTQVGIFHPIGVNWDTATGERRFQLSHEDRPLAYEIGAAYTQDGSQIVSISAEANSLSFWDAATGKRIRHISGHGMLDNVVAVSFSPNGDRLMTAGGYNSYEFDLPIFTPTDSSVRFWDPLTGAPLGKLEGHTGRILYAVFSPDGSRLLTASLDGTARLWDMHSGEELHAFHTSLEFGFTGVAFSPDGERLVLGALDGSIRIYDANTLAVISTVGNGAVQALAYAPDGSAILTSENASAGPFVHARLRSSDTGLPIRDIGDGLGLSHAVAFSPDGTRILTMDGANAYLWDTETGEELQQFTGHDQPITCLAFSPNGKFVVTGQRGDPLTPFPASVQEASVRVWEVETGEELRAYVTWPVAAVTFSPNGEQVVAAMSGPSILEWDIADISPFIVGDVNNDGHADALDVQLVINAALGMPIPIGLRGDRTFSGKADAVDVQLVINHVLGLNGTG